MKAIRMHEFGGPEVLKLQEVADLQPAGGQVVVDVKAVGVNPVETYIRKGIYGDKAFPYTPGTDAAGVVRQVGPGVKGIKTGDRVYTYGSITGTYAEQALCEAAQVYPLPANVSFSQGAALGVPFGTAYYGLFYRARSQAGETALIHGATGGVGTAAVQMAVAFGLTVIGTGGSESGRKLVKELGAQHVLDHHDPNYLKQLMQITEQRGVDLILEMLANVNLGKDLGVLAKSGRVVVIGSRGKVEIDPREMMGRNTDIRGMSLMHATPAELRGIHAAIGAGLANGALRPIVDQEIPLAEAGRAHTEVMDEGSHGKIVLVT
jgi:NADPH2:quinone reductase